MAISEDQIQELRVKFGRVGIVRFEGHLFVFQQPNEEHARFYRRTSSNAATSVDAADMLATQLIVAMDDMVGAELAVREPIRVAFRSWLKTRPLAMDNVFFVPVLNELLGLAEEGAAAAVGKGCLVSSNTQGTSP